MKDVKCELVCTRSYIGGKESDEKKLQLLRKGIAVNYQHHWIVGKVKNNSILKNTLIISIDIISGHFQEIIVISFMSCNTFDSHICSSDCYLFLFNILVLIITDQLVGKNLHR